jgi:hypothetical protein
VQKYNDCLYMCRDEKCTLGAETCRAGFYRKLSDTEKMLIKLSGDPRDVGSQEFERSPRWKLMTEHHAVKDRRKADAPLPVPLRQMRDAMET